MIFLIFILPFVLILTLRYLSKRGNGGTIGSKIRSSNWAAWNDAVTECEDRLRELRNHEPPNQ